MLNNLSFILISKVASAFHSSLIPELGLKSGTFLTWSVGADIDTDTTLSAICLISHLVKQSLDSDIQFPESFL